MEEKFGPPIDVEPYGLTLVIQKPDFDSYWEQMLTDLGYSCHFAQLDRHQVIFIPLKRGLEDIFVHVDVSTEKPVSIDPSDVILDLVIKHQTLAEKVTQLQKSLAMHNHITMAAVEERIKKSGVTA